MLRMGKKVNNDVFLVALIRALEVRLPDRSLLEQLRSCITMSEASEKMEKSLFSGFLREGESFDSERFMEKSLSWALGVVQEYSENPVLMPYLRSGFDCLNCIICLKSRLTETDYSALSGLGSCSTEEMKRIFETEKYSSLPAEFNEAVLKSVEGYFENRELLLIDLHFEKALYRYRKRLVSQMNSELMERYQSAEIDMKNLSSAVRIREFSLVKDFLKNFFIPGGNLTFEEYSTLFKSGENRYLYMKDPDSEISNTTIGSLDFEIRSLKYLYSILSESDYGIFGPEPVIAFVKRIEHRSGLVSFVLQNIACNCRTDMERLLWGGLL